MASAVKKASDKVILRLAESSSVRSNHCVHAVEYALAVSVVRCRAKEQTRSLRMGFRL